MAHDIEDNQTSVTGRIFWLTLSLLIAALFFYAASTTTGGGEAYAAGMGASASADWSGSAHASEDSSL